VGSFIAWNVKKGDTPLSVALKRSAVAARGCGMVNDGSD
jgi:hypothetical protein